MQTISILVADDNLTFLNIAVRFLQQYDDVVVVGTANGGQEALVKTSALRPDVVLVDLAMPDLPGLQVIPCLRAAQPQLGIIALTFLAHNGYRQAALEAGADELVPKSTMDIDLLPAIRRVVQQMVYAHSQTTVL